MASSKPDLAPSCHMSQQLRTSELTTSLARNLVTCHMGRTHVLSWHLVTHLKSRKYSHTVTAWHARNGANRPNFTSCSLNYQCNYIQWTRTGDLMHVVEHRDVLVKQKSQLAKEGNYQIGKCSREGRSWYLRGQQSWWAYRYDPIPWSSAATTPENKREPIKDRDFCSKLEI